MQNFMTHSIDLHVAAYAPLSWNIKSVQSLASDTCHIMRNMLNCKRIYKTIQIIFADFQ